MRELYEGVLGLSEVASWRDAMAFRLGAGILILFDREKIVDRDEPAADHGSTGPAHVCFLASEEEYERWTGRLAEAQVDITHEPTWGTGVRSFYFKDPSGNLLEIAEGDLWPNGG